MSNGRQERYGQPEGPSGLLSELHDQASYDAEFAVTLADYATVIREAVQGLTAGHDEIREKELEYRSQDFPRLLNAVRRRVEDKLPYLTTALGPARKRADAVIFRLRADIKQVLTDLRRCRADLTEATDDAVYKEKKLAAEQERFQRLLDLPVTVPDWVTRLTALESDMLKAIEVGDDFVAYATLSEINRLYEEELSIPGGEEYRDVLTSQWGRVVVAQKELLDVKRHAAELASAVRQLEELYNRLTADRVAELRRRWEQAAREPGGAGRC